MKNQHDEPMVLHDDVDRVVVYRGEEDVECEGSDGDDGPGGGDNVSVATPVSKNKRIKDV